MQDIASDVNVFEYELLEGLDEEYYHKAKAMRQNPSVDTFQLVLEGKKETVIVGDRVEGTPFWTIQYLGYHTVQEITGSTNTSVMKMVGVCMAGIMINVVFWLLKARRKAHSLEERAIRDDKTGLLNYKPAERRIQELLNPITVSMGIAIAGPENQEFDRVLKEADEALYCVKKMEKATMPLSI